MSDFNIITQVETILKKPYLISADNMIDAINQCDNLAELLLTKEFPNNEFFILILQHLRDFFNAEYKFQRKQTDKALNAYQKLETNIRDTQTKFPDLYSNWRYNIDRLMLRIDARIQETKAIIAIEGNDYLQADILYVETIKRYTNELKLEQTNNDYEHYFNSLMNIYQSTGFLYRSRGKNNNNRNELYEAIKNLKKAKFLGQVDIDPILSEIHEDIITLTLEKLEQQAETTFNNGLLESEAERFSTAVTFYHKSAQLYRLLNHIRNNIEYVLQEQIQLSSYYEAKAKSLMGLDDNERAAQQFSNASQILQKVLESISIDALKQNFEPQIDYFQAMHLFCLAVTEYDNMIPESINHFNESKEKIEKSKIKSYEINNIPLSKSCEDALNKINSYLEVASLMFQPKNDNSKDSEN